MIFSLQVILLALGLLLSNQYAIFIPLSLPFIYIFVIGPGTFLGTSDIKVESLKDALSNNWTNADELAKYIMKFWAGLQYCSTAGQHQKNCVTLSFVSFGLSIWYFSSGHIFPAIVGLMCGITLHIMSTRVNHPRSIYFDQSARLSNNPGINKEWDMAAMSIVAFAELSPNDGIYRYASDIV